jgi:Mg/Co/Ni transporter MgtE
MTYTMQDFLRDSVKKDFARLTPQEQREVLQALPPEKLQEVVQALSPEKQQEVLQALPPESLLACLSAEQIRQYLDQLTTGRPAQPRKPRRKK